MTNRAGYLAAAICVLGACSHASRAAKAEASAPPAVAASPATDVASTSATRTCSADDQCGANELCVSSTCVAITPELAECRSSAHFGFDRSDLLPQELPTLQRDARCLNALPGLKALVEGNCDERGTAQYNIALGFRRAHAVGKYLEDLGIAQARLSEVSYGKERPVCTESTEACWSQNRRADVAPRAGERGGDASAAR